LDGARSAPVRSKRKGDFYEEWHTGLHTRIGRCDRRRDGGAALAQTQWDREHPRRAEVNGRLENQDRRINQEVREGEITKGQAKQLHAEDHAIRQEERAMAKTNNGHITGAEQKALNQQENQVSRQIGR
jgi:hypothetical protein